jgi:uncharacterized protein (DUF924 family)
MRDVRQEILSFWFQETKPAQWFQKNPVFDEEIRARFEGDCVLASQDIYDGWMDSDKGCLALVILLDQFPRNMYRGRTQMFATDNKALNVSEHALKKNFDLGMTIDEKAFLYLPFEHSEKMEHQERSLELFEKLKDDNPVYYDYAKRHYDVIRKFGRFPHRNDILERQSTKLEEEYLAKPDSGF